MGVDVTHIIRHPEIDVDDDAVCKAYCEETLEKLMARLNIEGPSKIYKDSWQNSPGTWKIEISRGEELGSIELSLLSDFWEVESFYHYTKLVNCPENDFWLRRLVFKMCIKRSIPAHF